jgi:sortase (surface protein transpeptidase)
VVLAALGVIAAAVTTAGCGNGASGPAGPAGTRDGGQPVSGGLSTGSVGNHPPTRSAGDRPPAAAAAGGSQAADPVRLRIPDIGVVAPVVPLGLDAAGRLEAPTEWSDTGWNRAGPEPGEAGTAVVAGHVDSRSGPAVFYRLRDLRPGAQVYVDRADSSTAAFTVDRLVSYPKEAVPAEAYRDTGRAELRLVTCGGAFDHARGSYRDNLVVFAQAD